VKAARRPLSYLKTGVAGMRLEVKPGGELHLSLAVDVVAVCVVVRAVVLHEVEGVCAAGGDGVGTVRDAGDVLVVHQIEDLTEDLEPIAAEAAVGQVEVLAYAKVHVCGLGHGDLVASQDVDAVCARS